MQSSRSRWRQYRRTPLDGFDSPSALFDGIYDTCGRGLGAGGIRALGGWTARDARMGARTNEFVSDHVRTRQHGGWGSHMGDGGGIRRSRSDLCWRGCSCRSLCWSSGIDFQSTSPREPALRPRRSITCTICAVVPDDDDGPITITIEYDLASNDREKFRVLMHEVQATFRRNGAFQCRLDESLNHPASFRLEYMVSTWAEHLRQNMRMTVDETQVFENAWSLHVGDSEPIVRHFLSTQRSMHLPGFGLSGRTFTNTSRMPKPRKVAVTSEA